MSSELDYLAKALRSGDLQPYIGSDTWSGPQVDHSFASQSGTTSLGGLPGSEFMGSMESIIQTAPTSTSSGLLTTQAIQDHIDLLIKIHRLEVKVGSSKWRLGDLCQRPELPVIDGIHTIQVFEFEPISAMLFM